MGNIVLDPGVAIELDLHVYAHCQRGTPGGVTLLVINASRDTSRSLMLPDTSERYTLDAASLRDTQVRLNGRVLGLSTRDDLPRVRGARTAAGSFMFAPATITFLTTSARNNAC
jgi:hypothetical protein